MGRSRSTEEIARVHSLPFTLARWRRARLWRSRISDRLGGSLRHPRRGRLLPIVATLHQALFLGTATVSQRGMSSVLRTRQFDRPREPRNPAEGRDRASGL